MKNSFASPWTLVDVCITFTYIQPHHQHRVQMQNAAANKKNNNHESAKASENNLIFLAWIMNKQREKIVFWAEILFSVHFFLVWCERVLCWEPREIVNKMQKNEYHSVIGIFGKISCAYCFCFLFGRMFVTRLFSNCYLCVCVASVSVYPAKINQLPASLRNSITKIIKHHSTQNEKKMKPNEEKNGNEKKEITVNKHWRSVTGFLFLLFFRFFEIKILKYITVFNWLFIDTKKYNANNFFSASLCLYWI